MAEFRWDPQSSQSAKSPAPEAQETQSSCTSSHVSWDGIPHICQQPDQPTPAPKLQYVPPRLCSPFALDLQDLSLQPLSYPCDAT